MSERRLKKTEIQLPVFHNEGILDLEELSQFNITITDYVVLYLIYCKEYDKILHLVGYSNSLNNLLEAKMIVQYDYQYAKDSNNEKYVSGIKVVPNRKFMNKLFKDQTSSIDFKELYLKYPEEVIGADNLKRPLRSSEINSFDFLSRKKEYLAVVKTTELHDKVVKALDAQLALMRKSRDGLAYLPKMENWIKNCEWEKYFQYIGKQNDKPTFGGDL